MIDKLKEYLKTEEAILEFEEQLKKLKKYKEAIAKELVEESIETGIEAIEYNNKKYKFDYETVYNILGGKKDSPQRQHLFDLLEEMGYSDDIRIIKTMDGRKLNSVIKKLPLEKRQELIENKILSAYPKPKISARKK